MKFLFFISSVSTYSIENQLCVRRYTGKNSLLSLVTVLDHYDLMMKFPFFKHSATLTLGQHVVMVYWNQVKNVMETAVVTLAVVHLFQPRIVLTNIKY